MKKQQNLLLNSIFLSFCVVGFVEHYDVQADLKTNIKTESKIVSTRVIDFSKGVGSHISDASLTAGVKANILANKDMTDYKRINIDTKQRIVYLKGEVPSEEAMIHANQKAKEIKGVRGVINMLKVTH